MNLQQQLEEALRDERYEEAAELRDRIAAGEVGHEDDELPPNMWFTVLSTVNTALSAFNETPHEFYVRNAKEERARTIAAYERMRQAYQDGVAKAKREKLQEVMLRSEGPIMDILSGIISRKQKKKVSASWVKQAVVSVRDQRESTEAFFWRGKQVLRVKYTEDGFEVLQ